MAPNSNATQVWEIRFTDDNQRYFVRTLDTAGGKNSTLHQINPFLVPILNLSIFVAVINIWKEEVNTMDIMVESPRSAQVAGMLHERDIPYAIAIGDLNPMLLREQGSSFIKDKRNPTSR